MTSLPTSAYAVLTAFARSNGHPRVAGATGTRGGGTRKYVACYLCDHGEGTLYEIPGSSWAAKWRRTRKSEQAVAEHLRTEHGFVS